MNKRRNNTIEGPPPAESATLNGDTFEPGDFFRLVNRPGQRYRFISYREDRGGAYVSAYGGDKAPLGRQQFHAFKADELFIKVYETKDERRRREAQEAERAGIRAD